MQRKDGTLEMDISLKREKLRRKKVRRNWSRRRTEEEERLLKRHPQMSGGAVR